LLTLALLPKPPEPPKNVLKLNGKTPVVTFKKELPPETIKEDKALTAVKKPVTATPYPAPERCTSVGTQTALSRRQAAVIKP
jgi:hypothetical protein